MLRLLFLVSSSSESDSRSRYPFLVFFLPCSFECKSSLFVWSKSTKSYSCFNLSCLATSKTLFKSSFGTVFLGALPRNEDYLYTSNSDSCVASPVIPAFEFVPSWAIEFRLLKSLSLLKRFVSISGVKLNLGSIWCSEAYLVRLDLPLWNGLIVSEFL